MAHNPYTPPGAVVEDSAAADAVPRPGQLKVAILLMWLSLAASLATLLLFPEEMIGEFKDVPRPVVIGLVSFLAVFMAFVVVLIVGTARGWRWARIVYTIVLALSYASTLANPAEIFEASWYLRLLYLMSLAVDLASIVLLYMPATNAWFRARANSR